MVGQGQAGPHGDGLLAARPGRVLGVGDQLLVLGNGLVGVARRDGGPGHLLAELQRDRRPGAEVLAAAGGQLAPVAERALGHPGLGQALADPGQQRVRAVRPQLGAAVAQHADRTVPVGLLQAGRSGAHDGAGGGAGRRPGAEDRVGRDQHGAPPLRRVHGPPDRFLQRGGRPHGADRVARRDPDQAELLQVPVRRLHAELVGLGDPGQAGDVAGRGDGGQDRSGDARRAEDGGQLEGRPGLPGGGQLDGPAHGDHPGRPEQVAGGLAALRPVALAGQPVLAGALPALLQVGHREIQAGRQAAEPVGDVERARDLVVVLAEPVGQVAQRLALAEHGQADGQVLAGRLRRADAGPRGGDQDLAGRPVRPQPVRVGRVGQAVEHDQPAPAGGGQPGQEPGGGGFRLARRGGDPDVGERLGAAGDDAVAAAGRQPDEQVELVRGPQAGGERGGQVGLAGATRRRPGPRGR